ncbi:uncharacterized protein MONBRDRAFT_7858 [Monosiga brevicollis MX1]|uniref:Uncharacterized protein n=1 Tax=Monosiga brevicollis TaxID=81824 RepID=A9UXM5_MONBE|nr:uncharacterized protein MONBRDRAFT_7858 [Monosiga brevicollis MX1]EDQ90035.1 predicted protein [Monosiga brevicollis MX1]|eukprot:XP_001745457.1 hypothetical protein [Monosiga brevicollis MX1]
MYHLATNSGPRPALRLPVFDASPIKEHPSFDVSVASLDDHLGTLNLSPIRAPSTRGASPLSPEHVASAGRYLTHQAEPASAHRRSPYRMLLPSTQPEYLAVPARTAHAARRAAPPSPPKGGPTHSTAPQRSPMPTSALGQASPRNMHGLNPFATNDRDHFPGIEDWLRTRVAEGADTYADSDHYDTTHDHNESSHDHDSNFATDGFNWSIDGQAALFPVAINENDHLRIDPDAHLQQ